MSIINNFQDYSFFILFIIAFSLYKTNSEFIKLKKLPDDNYFIIESLGLYNYNSKFCKISTIHSFPENFKIKTKEEIKNTIISEIKQEEKTYIISLSKKSIYIYNYIENKIYYSPYILNELSKNGDYMESGVSYKLIPYKLNSNILSFIIVLMETNFFGNSILFLYYNIDIIRNKINFEKEKKFKDKSYSFLFAHFSNLSPYNISCHLFPSTLESMKCFYCLDEERIFKSMNYVIKDEPNEDNKVTIKENYQKIIEIKSSISNNKINFFSCYLLIDKTTHCFYNNQNININEYIEIESSIISKCNIMETYYFEEKEEFILLCQIENYKFIMKRYNIISNSLNYINSLEFSVQGCSKLKEFSLIYNKTSEDYNLISDCNLIEDQKYCFIEENTENMINSENNFIDFKTSEEKPSEDKPSEEGSGEDESSEEKSSEDKPSEENPNEDKPSEEKPSEVLPSEKSEENINKIEEDSTEIIINEKHFSITDKPIYIIERDSLNEYLNQLIKENNDTNIEFFVYCYNYSFKCFISK